MEVPYGLDGARREAVRNFQGRKLVPARAPATPLASGRLRPSRLTNRNRNRCRLLVTAEKDALEPLDRRSRAGTEGQDPEVHDAVRRTRGEERQERLRRRLRELRDG